MGKIRIKKVVNQIKKTIKKKPKKKRKLRIKTENLLSSGSTLLNLACTNNPFGAFMKGKYNLIVGDSDSGKTFLSMTCLAEASKNKSFKNYRLIYDNVEDGMSIDLEKLFNTNVAKRLEPPNKDDKGNPIYSENIEEFYYNLDDALKEEKPCIYILDSMDGLDSEADEKKFKEYKKAHRKRINPKDIAGSYGTAKAKKNSEGLRKVRKELRKTGSILIIISQTRDNIGFGFNPKTRSGGHSLKFYAILEFWSNVIGYIKKTVRGKPRKIGVHVQLKMKKNHLTGEYHDVKMDIYPTYGIDDIGSCVDYLIDEAWWKKPTKKTIAAKEFEVIMDRKKLIEYIEENELQRKLQIITGQCWKEIREACSLNRKNRYKE